MSTETTHRSVFRTHTKRVFACVHAVELLVVIAIIGILVALLLPAIQAAARPLERYSAKTI